MPDDDDDLPETPRKPVKGKKPAPAAVSPPPPPPPAEPAPPPKEKHSSKLVQLATHFGYTQADLDTTPSATLWEEIRNIEEMHARRQPKPEPVAAKKEEPSPKDEDEEFLAVLDQTDTDPRYTNFLRRQHARTKAAEAKAARIDDLEKRDQARVQQSQSDAVEAGFAKLAENAAFKALIGEGMKHEIENDPGALGWRTHIVQRCGGEPTDSPAVITRKIIAAGTKLLGAKAPAATSPPPPPAAPAPGKKVPPKDPVNGQFVGYTVDEFAGGKLPAVGERNADRANLTGAARIHQHMREVGDDRAEGEFVDPDDDSDLPGPGD